jgi:hypothetical protein
MHVLPIYQRILLLTLARLFQRVEVSPDSQ